MSVIIYVVSQGLLGPAAHWKEKALMGNSDTVTVIGFCVPGSCAGRGPRL